MKHTNLLGKTFGRWKVTAYMGFDSLIHSATWRCLCKCGARKTISAKHLVAGASRSCGCLRREKFTTHGKARTKEWNVWIHMKSRCQNPGETSFKDYGGRGIKVCERWNKSFSAFLSDMGPCPQGYEIDRIDNDGDYKPSNCSWVDRKSNCQNKRNSAFVEADGRRMTIAQWADELNVPRSTLYDRKRRGWSDIDVIGRWNLIVI